MFTLCWNAVKAVRAKREKKVTLVLLGLDNAGKTTLLRTVMGASAESIADVTPTFGFTKESTVDLPYTIDIFDLGGGKRIRGIWKHYLAEVHGVVFVVDAADIERFPEAKEVLADTLGSAYLSNKPILILANKQDIPTAASASDVASALGLSALRNNRYTILPCSARAPEGSRPDKRVREGMNWLTNAVGSVYRELEPRVRADAAVEAEREREEKAARKERVAAARAAREREREAEAAGESGEAESSPLVNSNGGGGGGAHSAANSPNSEMELTENRNQINAGQPGSPLALPAALALPGTGGLLDPTSPSAIPGGVRSDSPSQNRVKLEPLSSAEVAT